MAEIDYNIRPATAADRSHLANLIHFGSYLHQHLDWKPALDWIGRPPYLLLEKKNEIQAVLACPPELPDITWIRLYAANSLINVEEAWHLLWQAALKELSTNETMHIAAISLQHWFNNLLVESNFTYIDDVVVLMWEKAATFPKSLAKNITIRPMYSEDFGVIEEIDHDAFDTVWKNSRETLELAYQQSSLASVAELDGEIVGYQFSTSSVMGGHLARLAVKKTMQGRGIGYSLVYDLLTDFTRRGIERVTVNTQQKNTTSLSLYSKAGFTITGEAYQVYERLLSA